MHKRYVAQYTISTDIYQTQYQHILSNRIPYYQNDSIYNERTDRQNFKLEIGAWDKLMEQRNIIAGLLYVKVKDAYNIGAYRLMFNRLRQLKNEFEAYESQSSDMKTIALSDSCTYEELLAYPNFSTKFNDNQKRFD